jgi:hypothetical protein
MIKIYVENEKQRQFAITQMDEELKYNPNLNGADFEVIIDSDKYPSINNVDALVGASLMSVVFKR